VRKRIFLFSALLAAGAVMLAALLIFLTEYRDVTRTVQLETRTEMAYVQAGYQVGGEAYLQQLAGCSEHRITWISAEGEVLFDSLYEEADMADHADRPEVRDAAAYGSGESTRYSDTLQEQTYYYAVRQDDGTVLRIANTTAGAVSSFSQLIWLVLLIVAVVTLLSALAASFLTQRIVAPINELDLDRPEEGRVYEELTPLLTRIREQKLQLTHQMTALERQRAEFSAITANMDEGFLVLDAGGRVLSHNKSALALLDAGLPDADGRNVLELNRSSGLRTLIHEAQAGIGREAMLELGGRQCQVIVSPVRENGIVQGIVLVLLDVTERQEREQLRREFTANVSHELKTPLTAISGYAEIMKNGMVAAEDVPEFSENIYREAQRMIVLIRDLMQLSRLEENTPLPSEPVCLYALAQNVVRRLQEKAQAADVCLYVEGTPLTVSGMPSVLDEMLSNLVDNAIKYNRPGGRVDVTAEMWQGRPALTVRDTGMGIARAEQERIFERFYRVDKSRNAAVEGTGLGLAIVKHGAILHHAEVTLHSREGEGTLVRLLFPPQNV